MNAVTPPRLDRIAELVRHDFVVIEDFLTAPAIDALHADLNRRFARGDARPAGVGRRHRFRVATAVRGDHILWFDPLALSAPQQRYWRAMEQLRVALNHSHLLGLDTFEAHYAHYPAGRGYARHRDVFADDDARIISCSLYLNPAWAAADGGALRLYTEATAHDILPTAGTLVLFSSRSLEHEVLPARRDRYSVTGWFRRRPFME